MHSHSVRSGVSFTQKVQVIVSLFTAKSLRLDGYTWRNDGSKKMGKTNIVKQYRKIRMPDGSGNPGFRREEYVLLDDVKFVSKCEVAD